MVVKIINKSKFPLPSYAKPGDSGMDLRNIGEEFTLKPLERKLVPTGIYVQLPPRTEIQVRARSGEAFKKGLGVLNGPATIDSNYRGEIGVILVNLSPVEVTVEHGEGIAQMVCAEVTHMELEEVSKLDETERGGSGYGSSGIQ